MTSNIPNYVTLKDDCSVTIHDQHVIELQTISTYNFDFKSISTRKYLNNIIQVFKNLCYFSSKIAGNILQLLLLIA